MKIRIVAIVLFLSSILIVAKAVNIDTCHITVYDTIRVVVYDTMRVSMQSALRRDAASIVTILESTSADTITRQMGHTIRYVNWWAKMIPRMTTVQFAGNMGFASLGLGWKYGRRVQMESSVLVGIVPKHDSNRAKLTMTLKQNVVPFHLEPHEKVHFVPITLGGYVNMVFGDEFWTNQPDRYPSGYYWFSTRFRFNLCVGQRIEFNIYDSRIENFHRNVGVFYEFSINDLYMIEAIKNQRHLKLKDYLTLSLGITLQLF